MDPNLCSFSRWVERISAGDREREMRSRSLPGHTPTKQGAAFDHFARYLRRKTGTTRAGRFWSLGAWARDGLEFVVRRR